MNLLPKQNNNHDWLNQEIIKLKSFSFLLVLFWLSIVSNACAFGVPNFLSGDYRVCL